MIRTIIFISIISIFIGCKKEPDVHIYSLQMKLKMPDGVSLANYKNIQVNVTNLEKNYSFTTLTDDNASIFLNGLEAGFYQASAIHQTIRDNTTLTLNGLSSIDLMNNAVDTMTLKLGKFGKFIIREYYYSGSTNPSGTSYKNDQYVEVYNNTNETLYADGLSLIEHQADGESDNDWEEIKKDSIVVEMIWTVPGSGNDYPILPGNGFLMAQDALNHKSNPDGNPNCPVDLGNAEFEFFGDLRPGKDIDFAAKNMIENFWVYKGIDISFHNKGKSAIALVRLPENKEEYIKHNLIPKIFASGSSRYFCKIHNSLVEDAVEASSKDALYKRFDASLDVGAVSVKSGSQSGLCIRRKILKKINGRTIYQDTNNSSVDFEHDVVPSPKNYDL